MDYLVSKKHFDNTNNWLGNYVAANPAGVSAFCTAVKQIMGDSTASVDALF